MGPSGPHESLPLTVFLTARCRNSSVHRLHFSDRLSPTYHYCAGSSVRLYSVLCTQFPFSWCRSRNAPCINFIQCRPINSSKTRFTLLTTRYQLVKLYLEAAAADFSIWSPLLSESFRLCYAKSLSSLHRLWRDSYYNLCRLCMFQVFACLLAYSRQNPCLTCPLSWAVGVTGLMSAFCWVWTQWFLVTWNMFSESCHDTSFDVVTSKVT